MQWGGWEPPGSLVPVCSGLAERLDFKLMTKVLSCLSLMVQLLALAIPYWMEVGVPGTASSMGLWNICLKWLCSKLPLGTVAFEVAKTLMTISTLLGFITVCAVLTSFHTFRKYKLAAIANTLTGLLMLTSVLVLGVSLPSIAEAFHPEMKPQRAWAFYIGCLASLLFLVSGLVSLLAHIHCPETPPRSLSQVSPGRHSLCSRSTVRLQEDQPRPEPPPLV